METPTQIHKKYYMSADIIEMQYSKAPALTRDFSRLWISTYELHEDRQERSNLLF